MMKFKYYNNGLIENILELLLTTFFLLWEIWVLKFMFKQIDKKLDCKWQENKDANINKQGSTKNEQTDKVSCRADVQFSIQNKNEQKP